MPGADSHHSDIPGYLPPQSTLWHHAYTPPHPDYGGADRFDYDANGNMTVKGLSGQQRLVWYAKNRLSQVQDRNGDLVEQYW